MTGFRSEARGFGTPERARRPVGVLWLALLAVLAAAPPASAQGNSPLELFEDRFAGDPDPSPFYLIQPKDLLRIFVYGEPELSGPVLVRPDGRISVNLAQDVQAAGLTPGQLKTALETRLLEYLEVPNVTVIVEQIYDGYRVFVTGEVRTPGAIASDRPITVLQALAQAGSFDEYARKNDIVIMRGSGRSALIFNFHWDRVIRGERLEQNIELESGDVVVVPR